MKRKGGAIATYATSSFYLNVGRYVGHSENTMESVNYATIQESDVSLVCKYCGYKQEDPETIHAMMQRFPGEEVHDIPYMCSACDSQLPF